MVPKASSVKCPNIQIYVLIIFLAGCAPSGHADDETIRQAPDKYTIRVLLDEGITKAKLKVDTQYQLLEPDLVQYFDVQRTEGTINIAITAEGIKIGEQVFKTKRLIVQPPDNEPFTLDKRSYRGNLELIADGNNKSMMAINNVSIETYLAGVIGAEMPSYWDNEALKAQAIAARTYCLYIKNRFGSNRLWDVRTTQANQVYKGITAETIRTVNAVNSTFGMALCSETETGDCVVFPAYYSSICGGHTENAENVFGEGFASLEGIECPYCSPVTRLSLFYWPMATFDKKEVSDNLLARYPNLKSLEKIEKIEPREESVYNNNFKRMTSVTLVGVNGKTANLRAEDMRLAIDPTGMRIQSTSCVIINLNEEIMFLAGRGFGHGVGLCQYGAREMARQGKNSQQILSFYYPHSLMKTLY